MKRSTVAAALLIGLVAVAQTGGLVHAQAVGVPSYPTPMPVPTPLLLQSVQLTTLPSLTQRSVANSLSRFERKAQMLYVPNLGNETIFTGSPGEVYAQTTSLYAARTAETRAIAASARGVLSVPLRKASNR